MKSWFTSSFARFLLVGIFNTLVGLGITFLLFNLFRLGYWPSTFLGNTIGAIISYMLNKTFTFRSEVSVQKSWWKFAIVISCCYGFSYGTSSLLGDMWTAFFPLTSPKWVNNGTILLGNGIYTVSNFLGHKYFTFRTKEHSEVWKGAGNGSDR
jgi:putative flippase GtrA